MRILAAFLCFSQLAFADCVTVSAPGVPRPYRTGVAYKLIFDAGVNEIPTDGAGLQPGQSATDQICANGLVLANVITDATMLTQFTADEAARQAAATAEQQARQLLDTERVTLETDVDAGLTNWVTLTPAQKTEVLRKSMRLNRVERALGQ